ncbi:hypothetical protein [Clostridium botulinum]|uniref:hypothetical protein n=1 Tax=Clostridium botulinum TaxID=1491 RepID=UPI0021C115D8|nr:hypothetical protein [Clostridium botulinum]
MDKKKESSNTSDLIKDENLKRDKDSIQIFKNINDIYLKLENFKFEFNKISTKINELEKRIEKMENSK